VEYTRTIANPLLTVLAAKIAGLPLSLACALISQESYGGLDIWGGDSPAAGESNAIFTLGGKYTNRSHPATTQVTRRAYLAYLSARGSPGPKGNAPKEQGVGPTQLTEANVQDDADVLGGANRSLPNMIVGFAEVAELIKQTDPNDPQERNKYQFATAVERYNAFSATAPDPNYSGRVLAYQAAWESVLGNES